ncbi:probable inactive receptor kinase At5g53320 [Juglans microcarpa x Juglans regia]|uniref:probable inactive receptor kinase At5g53320 n=1 Tax=Juglans microcarpa x Juglans regia TaxID=2249226 RepID=UPI001B7EC1B8|nr:probable inactive receptor kinase At5g53320 [Juglans microcarpa x Juglans regia]
MAAFSEPQKMKAKAVIVEAIALIRTIEVCREMGFNKVVFEGDALIVINAVKEDVACWAWYGQVVEDVKSSLKELLHWEIQFVRREGNMIAHSLAKDYNINGTVPPFICNLKNLTTFDVYNNSFHSTEFPRALYNCSKLKILDLSQNYFYGAIPDDIHRMSLLRELNLEGNNFDGNILASIG